MKIIFSKRCLEYFEPGHIESPHRISSAFEFLKGKGYKFVEPKLASEDDILRVHDKDYIEKIKSLNFYDPDTPAYPNIYEYARLSAGGAILAAEEKGFSLMRPPGHHAGIRGRALGAPTLGFCYLNNIAIAVKRLNLRTLILDIDGHAGNGTQEIFFKDKMVKFISLHRGDIYPGTGLKSEENCLNFPLLPDVGDETYLKILDKALKKINNIDIIGVSLGLDSRSGDLASLGLSPRCYYEIGKRLSYFKLPIFAVLEGGYGKGLGEYIHQFIKGVET